MAQINFGLSQLSGVLGSSLRRINFFLVNLSHLFYVATSSVLKPLRGSSPKYITENTNSKKRLWYTDDSPKVVCLPKNKSHPWQRILSTSCVHLTKCLTHIMIRHLFSTFELGKVQKKKFTHLPLGEIETNSTRILLISCSHWARRRQWIRTLIGRAMSKVVIELDCRKLKVQFSNYEMLTLKVQQFVRLKFLKLRSE